MLLFIKSTYGSEKLLCTFFFLKHIDILFGEIKALLSSLCELQKILQE